MSPVKVETLMQSGAFWVFWSALFSRKIRNNESTNKPVTQQTFLWNRAKISNKYKPWLCSQKSDCSTEVFLAGELYGWITCQCPYVCNYATLLVQKTFSGYTRSHVVIHPSHDTELPLSWGCWDGHGDKHHQFCFCFLKLHSGQKALFPPKTSGQFHVWSFHELYWSLNETIKYGIVLSRCQFMDNIWYVLCF